MAAEPDPAPASRPLWKMTIGAVGLGSPGRAVCPPFWEDGSPVATRRGNLVPPGATEAILCEYPFRAPDPMPLGSTYRVATTADAVVDLLNRAPETRPPDVECLLGGTTDYNIVLGYPDRQPAVVHVRSCAVDQGRAVRYEVGLDRLTALFGVRR